MHINHECFPLVCSVIKAFLSLHRLTDGNEYLFQAKDDVSLTVILK